MAKNTKPKLKTDENTENVKLAVAALNNVSKWIISDYKLLFFNGDLWAKKDDIYEVVIPEYLRSWIKKDFHLLTPRQIDIVIQNAKDILDHDDQYSLDKYKNKVFFTNGIYHLNTGEFEELERAKIGFSPNIIPYNFKSFINDKIDKDKKDKIDRLIRIFGQHDTELMMYLLEIAGSAMSMRTPFSKFVIVYGDGNDGKSTFTKFLNKIVGDKNSNTFSLKRLSDSRKSEQAIMSFYGKTLVTDPDAARLSIRDISDLKQLTGGDMVEGRHLYQNAKRFVNVSTIVVMSNTVPKISESSFALDRRLQLFPMTRNLDTLKANQKVSLKELEEIMDDQEIHQYFAQMALTAFSAAIKRGSLTTPKKMLEMMTNFKVENNDIYRWLTEEGIYKQFKNDGEYNPKIEFSNFRHWCNKENNETKLSQKGFTQALNATLKNDFKAEIEATQKRIQGKNSKVYSIIDLAATHKEAGPN